MLPIPGMALEALPREGIRSYLYQRRPDHKHRGIDLPAKRGSPVLATAPGVVVHAVRAWQQGFTGYGRAVVLRHEGGAYTLYAHLETVEVERGEHVEAGELVGTVGGSSFTKAGDYLDEPLSPHLHFEAASRAYPMRSEDDRIDPVEWLLGTEQGHKVMASAGGAGLIAFALGVAAFVLLSKKGGRRA